MSFCNIDSPVSENYDCLQQGLELGKRLENSVGYVPALTYEHERDYCGKGDYVPTGLKYLGGARLGNPRSCFEKGFEVGSRIQYYGEYDNYIATNFRLNSNILIAALLIVLIVFGLLFVLEVYWAWALLISLTMGSLFWYYYTKTYFS
jgi:hypothetical protein